MEVKYKDIIYSLDIEKKADGGILNKNGEKKEYLYKVISKNMFLLNKNGKNISSFVADDDSHYYININGENFTLDKYKEEESTFIGAAGISSDKDLVKPPMPGSIVKVVAAIGEKVIEGQALIIVEAMKMETTLYSSIDGIVTEINVEAGEQVDSDKVLVVVEKEKSAIV